MLLLRVEYYFQRRWIRVAKRKVTVLRRKVDLEKRKITIKTKNHFGKEDVLYLPKEDDVIFEGQRNVGGAGIFEGD